MSDSGFVVVLVVHLHFPEAGSLKAKRRELSSIKAQLHGRLGAAVSETAHHDLWQRATLTAAVTGRSAAGTTATADGIERWLHHRWPDGVRVERLLASVDDLRDFPRDFPSSQGSEG